MNLTKKHCVPCEGGTAPLNYEQIKGYMSYISEKWENIDDKKIQRNFMFDSYMDGVKFAGKVGELANDEDHHPDISIFYKRVEILLSTHAIGGLSENDFIVASKIDEIN